MRKMFKSCSSSSSVEDCSSPVEMISKQDASEAYEKWLNELVFVRHCWHDGSIYNERKFVPEQRIGRDGNLIANLEEFVQFVLGKKII